MKDSQINIFCILDRIRVSGTCSHLHIALTYHISIVFVAHFNRLGSSGGFLPLRPMLFQSVMQWHGCVGLSDLTEIVLLVLTPSSYNLSAAQGQQQQL